MLYIYGLVQERRNSSALAMELVFLALIHRYYMLNREKSFKNIFTWNPGKN